MAGKTCIQNGGCISQDPFVFNRQFFHMPPAACRSQHHTYRLGFAVDSKEDAVRQLRMNIDNETEQRSPRSVEGVAPSATNAEQEVVFVFSGMGTQWWGMARELMHSQPAFASRMKVIDKLLENCGAKWSLASMLSDEKNPERINQTDISQPCLFAVAIGLLDLWKLRGVVPDAVVGHSVGEVAAAYAAGLLSLEHAVKLIYRRGRELRKTSGSGKMVAVLQRVEEALQYVKGSKHGKMLDVAAINSPGQIVFSGENTAIEGLANEMKSDDIKCVVLKVNNAFHSKQQEVVKHTFVKKVGKFLNVQNSAQKRRTIPMMSTVTKRYLTADEAHSPDYWFRNVRQKVSFMNAIQNLTKDGYRVFVEIGPHSSLLPALRDTVDDIQTLDEKFIMATSLLRPKDTSMAAKDSENLLLSQMQLHVNGIPTKFHSLFDSTFRRVVAVPHHPWQREQCINLSSSTRKEFLFPASEGQHMLLGMPWESFYLRGSPVKIWRADLDASRVPWVKDHVLQGVVVVPAAAYTETALAAARSLNGDGYPIILSGLTFDRFMFAPNAEGCLETTVEEKAPDQYLFTLRSHDVSRHTWTQHCHLNIIPPSANQSELKTSGDTIDVKSIVKRCEITQSFEDFYKKAKDSGFELGPTFRGVQKISMSEDLRECLLYAEAPASVQREFHHYVYHPAFMDSFLQAFAVLLLVAAEAAEGLLVKSPQTVYRVPRSIKTFTLSGPASPLVYIHMKISGNDEPRCDIDVADANTKKVFCSVGQLAFETIQTARVEPQVWSVAWENIGSLAITKAQTGIQTTKRKIVIFPDDTEISSALIGSLMKEDFFDITVLDTKKSEALQQAIDVVASNQDTNTLLIMMKTEVSEIDLDSGSVMSRSEFEVCQEGTLFCYYICQALHKEGLNVNFLLFTQGGLRAKDEDNVSPFAEILNTVGITVLHEEPLNRMFYFDLPVTNSSMECAQLAKEVIYKEDFYTKAEDVIAIRRATTTKDHNDATWHLFSPRLIMENLSKASGVVPARHWAVGEQNFSDRTRMFIQKSHPNECNLSDLDYARVKVDAFSIYKSHKKNLSHLQNESRQSGPYIFVYAGSVNRSVYKDVSALYLGITSSHEIQAVVTSLSNDLTEVPSHLKASEAVSIVNDYLPTAIFFKQSVPISAGMCISFKVDSLDTCCLAAMHLSTKIGAEVFLLKDGLDDLDLSQTGISVRFLNELVDASVDLLFLSLTESSLDYALHSLRPKLRRNATIVIMQRQGYEGRLSVLPSKVKVVTFDTDLPSAVEGLSSAEISTTLSDLWEMFNPEVKDGHPICETHNLKKLSSLAAKNVDIPTNEVIDAQSTDLLLPLSLENDGFVADGQSSYFITGGTRGFGLRLLEWLISRGARYIYAGSRGEMNDDLKEVIQNGMKVGAQVQHIQMDISNACDVERALQNMRDGRWPALSGIFHCAAVFEDGFLQNITAKSWNRVMAPKAYGALLLHQLTQKLDIKLSHFIMTSSIVSLVGNAGQGSYCAANVFLNALAHYRRSHNLPATAVQIGVINDVGFAVRSGLVQMWEKMGAGSMSPNEVLAAIGCAMSVRQPLLGISGPFNLKLWAEKHRGLMIQHFRDQHGTISMMKEMFHDKDVYLSGNNDSLLQSISKLPFRKAKDVVVKTLSTLLSQHLGLSDEAPHDASPISLGLDSLMASEVSQVISQQFEVTVGAVDLLNDKNTIQELSINITRQILAKANSQKPDGSEGEESFVSKRKNVVVEGEVPKSLAVKLVCFPSNGAGPSLFTHWIQLLLPFGIQILMIQLPGWEGREDEQPLTNLKNIVRLIHDELKPHLSDGPFVLFGHSMGSLIAFEVAHLFLSEDNISPHHFFVSAWYAPTLPYPHPEELNISPETFEKLRKTLNDYPKLFANLVKITKVKFSFMDDKAFFNTALMRRMLPCIEASIEIVKAYKGNHESLLQCDITALAGKQDNFAQPDLLNSWEQQKSRKHTFKRMTFPGKHMYILTNTTEIVKEVCVTCKKVPTK
ncbi:uncharacterized protein LOC110980639 isoform X4 [Acanthaster planci]|uniref:oleoyl-[acyl-carrier-protein] hydrolase n=1 Tax=Acanthaster planci TaxID=133434 RepID=A0A8B7YKQ1_ACAPL|nr:uncharacterized protein LOC110980639 isoform X4 [Acanthaster planci]